MLREAVEVTGISSLYKSRPYGFEEQSDFHNAVVRVNTTLSPLGLLDELQTVKNVLGKKVTCKNGPRTIDLDLLLHGQTEIKSERLEIPHPGLHERDFVLLPLAEIDPDLRHPTLGQSVARLAASLSVSYVESSEEFTP